MTKTRHIDIRVGESVLTVVPAVHYQVPFAEAVNAIACDALNRPDAIAVETGPVLAAAIVTWLREIGLNPHKHVSLPCLLGLESRQRYLCPEVRERAIALQIKSGRELSDFAPEVLARELDYRALCLAPLSPTDSIIEAIRCGIELDVPVHGVDLDEIAQVDRPERLLPDPVVATGREASYAKEAAAMIGNHEVARVDQRRELAMAARLKTLLLSHRRVLFTCGLAHGQRVTRLVRNPQVEPALLSRGPEATDLARYRRKVIDPGLAFQFLDRIPIVARLFERRRRHPLLDHAIPNRDPARVPALFDAKLRHGIRAYLQARHEEPEEEAAGLQASVLADFPRLARTHAALGLWDVPPVATVLLCAKAFIGDAFAAALARVMLRFPWATERDFPGCETVLPSMARPGDAKVLRIKRGRVLPEPTSVRGLPQLDWIGVSDDPNRGSSTEEAETRGSSDGFGHTWTPWERLVSGLSDQAVGLTLQAETRPLAEPFRDSIRRGIAPRETLRARARGEKGFYIYGRRASKPPEPADITEGWPVVWIFDSKPTADSSWVEYVVPMSWMTSLASDRIGFERRYARSYDRIAAIIAFGDSLPRIESEVSVFMLRGLILYSPVFGDIHQYMSWVELTAGSRNPFCNGLHPSGIPLPLWGRLKALGHAVGELAWQDDLVRMAIPFGRQQVTVIRPKHHQLGPVVHREAAQTGKRLGVLDLDHFTEGEVERAQRNLGLPGRMNGRTTDYSPLAEALIDEARGTFAQRMPEKWLRFGL